MQFYYVTLVREQERRLYTFPAKNFWEAKQLAMEECNKNWERDGWRVLMVTSHLEIY